MNGIVDMNRIREMRRLYPHGWMLVDKGNSRRIPFAFWADLDTGEWKAYKATEDGLDQLVYGDGKDIVVTGRAVNGLAVIGYDNKLLNPRPPRKEIDKRAGIEMYKKLVLTVQSWRGDSRKCGEQFFRDLMEDVDDPFLDEFIIKRTYRCS
jgi:hypothetical protein